MIRARLRFDKIMVMSLWPHFWPTLREDFSFRSSTEFRKTAENVLKLILLLIKSGFVERKCVILLLCCVIW